MYNIQVFTTWAHLMGYIVSSVEMMGAIMV